jgi:hypothetical protein
LINLLYEEAKGKRYKFEREESMGMGKKKEERKCNGLMANGKGNRGRGVA